MRRRSIGALLAGTVLSVAYNACGGDAMAAVRPPPHKTRTR